MVRGREEEKKRRREEEKKIRDGGKETLRYAQQLNAGLIRISLPVPKDELNLGCWVLGYPYINFSTI